MVPVPRDVRPGHAVRDDDADPLVLPGVRLGPVHLLLQPRRHVGQDRLQLAGCSHLSLDHDCPSCPCRQRLWILITTIIYTHFCTRIMFNVYICLQTVPVAFTKKGSTVLEYLLQTLY